MQEFKNRVFTLIQICLWMQFTLALFDLGALGIPRPAGDVFATYAFLIDPFYTAVNWFTEPARWLLYMFNIYRPDGMDSWFPISSAAELSAFMSTMGMGSIFTPTLFAGAVNWWVPVTSLLLSIASLTFDHSYEKTKNWVWNLIIEYVFQRKKTKEYEQALNKRTEDFARLDTQYRALAQETYSLKDSVITDELTQIFNKRFFINRLQQEFDTCKRDKIPLSLIMIDIDYFKKLNDTYGHLSGDDVLKAVAQVLKRFTPELCYPCRYGGEEFSIIMPRKGAKEAMNTARTIQENVQLLQFDKIDKKIRVTLSQGICIADFSDNQTAVVQSVDDILQLADKELYRSKMEGRNRVSVYSFTDPPEK